MDPLSEVLSLLKPGSCMAGGLDAQGNWAVAFTRQPADTDQSLKCFAVVSGSCWLVIEGNELPIKLHAGDVILLTGARHLRLTSDLSVPVVPFADLAPSPLNGGVACCNGGGDFSAVGGYFSFASNHAAVLLRLLPTVLHIRGAAERASILCSLEQMRQELAVAQPGGFLIVQQIAYVTLVQALRACSSNGRSVRPGWLYALADRQIGGAIEIMHRDVARRWTLNDLAKAVGMSRTTFSVRFKQAVGESAMGYLTRWKMLLAAERVGQPGEAVALIASSLGYGSESAFSAAFRRVIGCSPREYARQRQAEPPSARVLDPLLRW
jgi:AraC-like DNA-binding protein